MVPISLFCLHHSCIEFVRSFVRLAFVRRSAFAHGAQHTSLDDDRFQSNRDFLEDVHFGKPHSAASPSLLFIVQLSSNIHIKIKAFLLSPWGRLCINDKHGSKNVKTRSFRELSRF